ncbi:TldD/PmbA family protein [Prochlorothrix hollandica]|uniref:TldD/PmbA family protein n=1 Tax=Prochlorothrix hollandica TaxID=1223 RepID=UPI003342D137
MAPILESLLHHPQAWFGSLDFAADWVGLRLVQQQEQILALRDANPQYQGFETHGGAMVEVMVDGHLGYGSTPQLTPEGLRHAAQRAYHQAQTMARWCLHAHSPHIRPVVSGHHPHRPGPSLLSPGETTDLLRRICQTLKVSDAVVQTRASASTLQRQSWLFSSSGTDLYQESSSLTTHYGAIAKAGNIVQSRTDNGFYARTYRGGWERESEVALLERVQRVGEEAVALLTAANCPTTATTTLVLAPDQMLLQLHESVGHPLELDRILGDERNYAGGSFVRPEDFGHKVYGSPLMTVTFDPTVEEEIASYAFDDTGHPAQRVDLIRHGLLLRGLGGLESQARLQQPGVANARATSWNRPPLDRMANLNLEPGGSSLEAMITSIESGIYMHTNRSWSIDDQRYKFQFGCELAYRIEGGEITELLRNPNYRSVTPQFWHSLVQVGDASTCETYGSPVCGKGEPNQVISVGHRSPVCVFENIEVFGGG